MYIPSKGTADRFVGVAVVQQLFDAIYTTAVRRQITADFHIQLLQFQFVLVKYSMPQLRLLLLNEDTQHTAVYLPLSPLSIVVLHINI